MQSIVTKQATVFTLASRDRNIQTTLALLGFKSIGFSCLVLNKKYYGMHMYKAVSENAIAIYFGIGDKRFQSCDAKQARMFLQF